MERNSAATTDGEATCSAAVPVKTNTTELLLNDVIMGQYRASRRHVGNARFDQLLHQTFLDLLRSVISAPDGGHRHRRPGDYQEHAEQIYNSVQGYGGRFVAPVASVAVETSTATALVASHPSTLEWQVIDRSEAIQAIQQVLCENHSTRDMITTRTSDNIQVPEEPPNLVPSQVPLETPSIAPGGWSFSVDGMGNARLAPITTSSPGGAAAAAVAPSTEYIQPYVDLVRLQHERQRLYQYEQELQQFHRQQQLAQMTNDSHHSEQRVSFSWLQHSQQANSSAVPISDSRVAASMHTGPSDSDRSIIGWTSSSHPNGGLDVNAAEEPTIAELSIASGTSGREHVVGQQTTGNNLPSQQQSGWEGALQQPSPLAPIDSSFPRENGYMNTNSTDSYDNNNHGRSSSNGAQRPD